MSKAVASRMYQAVMLRQPAVNRRITPTIAAATAAVEPRRGFASHTPNENGQHNTRGGDNQDGADAGEAPPVEDEASARRAALLKRYGDRTASSGPVAVKADPAAADAQKSAGDEANHNEIWGDYVNYMEHQRKKGWKT